MQEDRPAVDRELEALVAARGVAEYGPDVANAERHHALVDHFAVELQVELELVQVRRAVCPWPPELRIVELDGEGSIAGSSCPAGDLLTRWIKERPADHRRVALGCDLDMQCCVPQLRHQLTPHADILDPCAVGDVEHDVAIDTDLGEVGTRAKIGVEVVRRFAQVLVRADATYVLRWLLDLRDKTEG